MVPRTLAIIGILCGLLLFGGCTAEKSPTSQYGTQGGGAQPAEPEEFTINETVLAKNVSFKVTAWGYAERWGRGYKDNEEYPQDGAKYVWVHFSSENAGNVPAPLPGDFNVEYRGVNATQKWLGMMDGAMMYNKQPSDLQKQYYPGTGREGFLIFEISENVGENEAEFFVNFDGLRFVLKLANPTVYSGMPLTITDEKIVCPDRISFSRYFCHVEFTLKNNLPTPYVSEGQRPITLSAPHALNANLTVDGKKQHMFGLRVLQESGIGVEPPVILAPGEEGQCRLPDTMTVDKDTGKYVYTNAPTETIVDQSGDSVTVTITLYEVGGEIVAQKENIALQLP